MSVYPGCKNYIFDISVVGLLVGTLLVSISIIPYIFSISETSKYSYEIRDIVGINIGYILPPNKCGYWNVTVYNKNGFYKIEKCFMLNISNEYIVENINSTYHIFSPSSCIYWGNKSGYILWGRNSVEKFEYCMKIGLFVFAANNNFIYDNNMYIVCRKNMNTAFHYIQL